LQLDTPLKVTTQVGRCRVVVTGAYHAAVFALAQGIPAVCLAGSSDYLCKFLGLQDEFGDGCEIIHLGEPDMIEKLDAAMERAWGSAEALRLPLQRAAVRQIESSWRAYRRVEQLVESRADPHLGHHRRSG
jgi:polysaccharide pyruvyl transferase WcaK-like protein